MNYSDYSSFLNYCVQECRGTKEAHCRFVWRSYCRSLGWSISSYFR